VKIFSRCVIIDAVMPNLHQGGGTRHYRVWTDGCQLWHSKTDWDTIAKKCPPEREKGLGTKEKEVKADRLKMKECHRSRVEHRILK